MLPPPPNNFILFQLDFDVKFPLLRLLLFLSDLKSTITFKDEVLTIKPFEISNQSLKKPSLLRINVVLSNYEFKTTDLG